MRRNAYRLLRSTVSVLASLAYLAVSAARRKGRRAGRLERGAHRAEHRSWRARHGRQRHRYDLAREHIDHHRLRRYGRPESRTRRHRAGADRRHGRVSLAGIPGAHGPLRYLARRGNSEPRRRAYRRWRDQGAGALHLRGLACALHQSSSGSPHGQEYADTDQWPRVGSRNTRDALCDAGTRGRSRL